MTKTISVRISDNLYDRVLQIMEEDNLNLSDVVIQALEKEVSKGSVLSRFERALERLENLDIQDDKENLKTLPKSKITKGIDNSKSCNTLYDKSEASEKLDTGKLRIIELVNELGSVKNIDLQISSILISEGITTPTGKMFTRDIVADTKRKMKKRGLL